MEAVRKPPGNGRDKRQEPDDAAAPPAESYRVDRVFTAAARPRPRDTGSQPVATAAAARPAASRRPPASEAADPEIALRHQLLRLQRQLADAQQELANRDVELAREVEKRTTLSAASDALRDQLRELQARVEALTADQARAAGLESRLRESVTAAEELSHEVDFERELRAAAQARAAELAQVETLDESERTAQIRQLQAELARVHDERDVRSRALEQVMKAASQREQTWEATVAGLREAQNNLLIELAELRDQLAASESVARRGAPGAPSDPSDEPDR